MSIVRLSDIALIERGRFSARPRNDPQYYGGHIPFIQTGDITNSSGIVSAYSQTLNEKGLGVSKLFPKGSLVITIAANIGDVAEVDFDFACPDSVVVIQPGKGVNPIWLKYYMQTRKGYFAKQATQNAQANINLETIKPLKLDLPPEIEQQKIVEILSDCDTAIESVSGLINQNKRKLQAISQRVFSSVYAGKASKLSDYLNDVNDKVVPSESTPLYSLTIEDGICEKTDRYERGYLVKDTSSKTYKKVEFNDIVFNPQNVRWGAIARSKVSHPVCLSPIYEVVRVKEDVAVPEFFDFLLTNQRQVAYYASKTEGSLIERMSFKIDAFMLLKFDIPNKADQIKMVAPLRAAQNEIFLLETQLDLLKQQKRGLMQQLLTGKLRVKGAS